MKIVGKFKEDNNFITVFERSTGTIFTIARATGDWGSRKIGDTAFVGGTITQEAFDRLEAECEEFGEFEIECDE